MPKSDLLQGTLDLLILKIFTLGPNRGWGIANRIRQISRDGLNASQGSLYPGLHRLELSGDVTSEMAASENNRRARITNWAAPSPARAGYEHENHSQAAKYAALADHFGAFFVLAGFAVENYLKARLLASRIASVGPFRDGKEAMDFVMDRHTLRKARRRSHDLVALAAAANVLTPQNQPLLERLTAHVLWAGRYPVPLDASDALFERTTRDRDLAEIKVLVEDLKR